MDVDPARIIVTAGASAGFVLTFLACFDEGDRVGVTEPGYPCYRNTLKALGVTPVGITLIADEIYHGITYTAPVPTVLASKPDAVVLNSFSKYFGMTGWRLGWIVAPEDLVAPIGRFAQNLYICAAHVSQIAGLAAFDGHDELEENVRVFACKRDVLLDGLRRAGLTKIAPADGAFYAYVDVSDITDDSWTLCHTWLNELSIASTPGIDFDPVRGHRFVRFSCAGEEAQIAEAVHRLAAWMAGRV